MPGNIDKVFNTEPYMRQNYGGADVGTKTEKIQEYLFPLTNTLPIGIKFTPPKGGSSIATATLWRGKRFRKKQEITFKIETNHAKYFDAYSAFELLFQRFLDYDMSYSELLQEPEDSRYLFVRRFNYQFLDNLPETMYWVHYMLTRDVNRWTRFKRLFACIDLNVDPVTISTIKYKLLCYYLEQRRNISMVDDPEAGMIVSEIDPGLLHKLMDLFTFMPYCYLFMVYKSLDLQINLADGKGMVVYPNLESAQEQS